MTLDTPVSKAIAQRLKNVGFDRDVDAIYVNDNDPLNVFRSNWNKEGAVVSAPTILEVIEWMFTKNVIVLPVLSWLETNTPFGYQLWVRESEDMEWHEIDSSNEGLSRQSAYLAGIEPALTFLESKMKESEG